MTHPTSNNQPDASERSTVTAPKKKLIEVSLPLEAINAEASREKSIRHGHPSTLHLYNKRYSKCGYACSLKHLKSLHTFVLADS